MRNKLLFLTKMSLNKKIKTKWFLIANLIFAILIVGLINIDSIIKVFGGDFNETIKIIVVDEVNKFDSFKSNFENNAKYVSDYAKTEVIQSNDSYEKIEEDLKEDENKILVVISKDQENYINSKVVSKEGIGSITQTLINTALTSIRSEIALNEYNITQEMYQNINKSIIAENVILSESNPEENMTIVSIMQIITLPLFMLIIFLVQMIGAEVNEEKSTKSMEIIISNVSPKVHFLSKIISANLFVIIQGTLLIIFAILGLVTRYFINGGNILGELDGEVINMVGQFNLFDISEKILYILPILLIMVLLTFIAYSLLAGILASMTTNLEDFQQLQTPIVIISLIGYYLAMMSSMFKGSLFIKIMSYVPFISSMLSPTLYVLGEISIIDLVLSILGLIFTIYLLMKYGLRIYKVGILNYSGNNLWKKMFHALGGK